MNGTRTVRILIALFFFALTLIQTPGTSSVQATPATATRTPKGPIQTPGNVTYHGGTVISGTMNVYTIFWEPAGRVVDPHYNGLINQYYNDVGASSLYKILNQYTQSGKGAPTGAKLADSVIDQDAYPGDGSQLSQDQIQSELKKVMGEKGWKAGSSNYFAVYTAEGVIDKDQNACGYHSVIPTDTIFFAYLPYPAGKCLNLLSQSPNNCLACDTTIAASAHEQFEAATDPYYYTSAYGSPGWYYQTTAGEIADLCIYPFSSPPELGNLQYDNGKANLLWNGHFYLIPEVWDNSANGGQGGCSLAASTTGKIVFNGYDAQGGQGLWVTDGTASGTIELGTGLNPADITTFGNQALFSGNDATGNHELWITNGTPGGTIELSHINNNAGGLHPSQIVVLGNKAFFNGIDASGNHELWVTDGKSIQELNNIPGEGNGGLNPADLTDLGNVVLFDGYDSTQNYELWVTDGTASGTRELTHITSNINGLGPNNITLFGNQALFNGWDSKGNDALWVTDGKTVTELPAGSPDEITVIGKQAVFRVSGSIGGLWVTDGTPAGTMQLLNIPHAAGTSLPTAYITEWGNQALLSALDSNDHEELWVTDGTVGGTIEVTHIVGSSSVQSLNPADITAFGGQALFYGIDANGNEEMWDFTGSTTIELTTPPATAGPYPSVPFPDITVSGDKAMFDAQGGNHLYSLWVTDGTTKGTTELTNIANASSYGLIPSDMTIL